MIKQYYMQKRRIEWNRNKYSGLVYLHILQTEWYNAKCRCLGTDKTSDAVDSCAWTCTEVEYHGAWEWWSSIIDWS